MENKKTTIHLEVISFLQVLIKVAEDVIYTGYIRLKDQEGSNNPGFYILIQKGAIVGVTGGETIADKLRNYNWATENRISLILDDAQNHDSLLESLIKFGVNRTKVETLFAEQIAEIIAHIGQTEGTIRWGKIENLNEFPKSEITGIKMDVHKLIFKAMEENFAPRYLERLPEKTLVIQSSDTMIPIHSITDRYQQLLNYADQDISIEKIAGELKTNILDIKKRVFLLEKLGLLKTGLPKDKATAYLNQFVPRQRINKNQITVTGDRNWKTPLMTLGAINLGLIILTWLGIFQSFEFALLDRFFKLRGTTENTTVTLVTIDDQDIAKLQKYPVTDEKLATAINNVSLHNPVAIGIDIYRDIRQDPGHEKLLETYKNTGNLIGVEKIGGNKVGPPPLLSDYGSVGFSDLIEDPDNILRRALISIPDELGNARLSLGSYLAYIALGDKGIEIKQLDIDSYQIGDTPVHSLNNRSGGYWKSKIEGWQMMLDYQHQEKDFQSISFSDVYNNNINPQQIVGKVVLFGINADSKKDYIYSPFSRNTNGQTIPEYGMVAHANIAAMLIDIGTGKNQPLTINSQIFEVGYLVFYSLVGIGFGYIGLELILKKDLNRSKVILIQSSCIILLALISGFLSFLSGTWIPVITPLLVGVICGLVTNLEYKNNIENLAYVDSKLKVPNRSYFDYVFANSLKKTIAREIPTALILIEIVCKDKEIPETMYWEKVRKIARIIKTNIRATDHDSFVAKYEKNYLACVIYETNQTKINNLIRGIEAELKGHKQDLRDFRLNFGTAITSEIINNPEAMKLTAAEDIK